MPNPADLYETTFYLKLPASDSPLLASGDYMAATTGEEMTIDASKSFWNFTDKDNHNDKIKNRLKEGTKITQSSATATTTTRSPAHWKVHPINRKTQL